MSYRDSDREASMGLLLLVALMLAASAIVEAFYGKVKDGNDQDTQAQAQVRGSHDEEAR